MHYRIEIPNRGRRPSGYRRVKEVAVSLIVKASSPVKFLLFFRNEAKKGKAIQALIIMFLRERRREGEGKEGLDIMFIFTT